MKKENNLITLIKGFIIGLGIIFPISSSILAIAMGIYEKILDIINNLFTKFKQNFKFILFLGIGIFLSVIVSSLVLDYTLNKFPLATMLLFIGLVSGGMPILFNKVKGKSNFGNILCLIIGIGILIGIAFLKSGGNAIIETNMLGLLKLFGVGMIGAISMIVPGLSGAVMLIILGYYEPLVEVISSLFKFQDIINNLLIAGVFGLGMLVGVIIASKVMAYFLEKYETKSYFMIIGFILASIMEILYKYMINGSFEVIELLIGLILFGLGYIVSFKYLKEE